MDDTSGNEGGRSAQQDDGGERLRTGLVRGVIGGAWFAVFYRVLGLIGIGSDEDVSQAVINFVGFGALWAYLPDLTRWLKTFDL